MKYLVQLWVPALEPQPGPSGVGQLDSNKCAKCGIYYNSAADRALKEKANWLNCSKASCQEWIHAACCGICYPQTKVGTFVIPSSWYIQAAHHGCSQGRYKDTLGVPCGTQWCQSCWCPKQYIPDLPNDSHNPNPIWSAILQLLSHRFLCHVVRYSPLEKGMIKLQFKICLMIMQKTFSISLSIASKKVPPVVRVGICCGSC